MKTIFTVTHLLLRLAGPSAIVMGLLFWNNLALNLIPFHMLAGVLVVLALWTLALLAARAGVHPGIVGLALVWGVIVPTLGIMQNQLLPNAGQGACPISSPSRSTLGNRSAASARRRDCFMARRGASSTHPTSTTASIANKTLNRRA